MVHQCETTMRYTNEKGDDFYVVREWDGEVGRFVCVRNGRKGYGKFWTKDGYAARRGEEVAYFTRTAMNGRSGLVERLVPVLVVNVPTYFLPL